MSRYLVYGVSVAVTLRQAEALRALILPRFLKSRINLCEVTLPSHFFPFHPLPDSIQ